ncbi:MAG: class I SAM-dependent methyltransferase, partial [Pseudomonadota bacterium]
SLSTRLDVETEIYACPDCGHAQSPDLADVERFYYTEYRISLASDAFDQLYDMRGGEPLYRTAHQAALVREVAEPPQGARVLDYGCAKATTLQRLVAARPDIRPAVFDVSEDYRSHWTSWVAAEDQATYRCPEDWSGRFDLITVHFVLEHVADPVAVLSDIARLLAPGGSVFLTVPDPLSNPGDLIVVDHLNHFTAPSLTHAFGLAGLAVRALRQDLFRGAHVVVAERATAPAPPPDPGDSYQKLCETAAFWQRARETLETAVAAHGDRPAAIYGAGFYGVFIASTLARRQKLLGHLDRNPHLQEAAPVSPVHHPLSPPPGIEVIYAGLNPAIARPILAEWRAETGLSPEVIFLDGSTP